MINLKIDKRIPLALISLAMAFSSQSAFCAGDSYFKNDNIKQLQELKEAHKSDSDVRKVDAVNRFFNTNIVYKKDDSFGPKKDHWSTAEETLSRGYGDCEDYALAKYSTLIDWGIDKNKLKLTYGKLNSTKEFHMVLQFKDTKVSEPLILDNLKTKLTLAKDEKNIIPIYSFNHEKVFVNESGFDKLKEINSNSKEKLSKFGNWVARNEKGSSYNI